MEDTKHTHAGRPVGTGNYSKKLQIYLSEHELESIQMIIDRQLATNISNSIRYAINYTASRLSSVESKSHDEQS